MFSEKGAQKLDVDKFEGVSRAGEALQHALDSHVSFNEFTGLVEGFMQEVMRAQQKAKTKKEKELVDLYAQAAEGYQDSVTLWGYTIQKTLAVSKKKSDFEEIHLLLNKYNIPGHYIKGGESDIPPYAISIIFGEAIKKVKEAEYLRKGSK